MIQNSPLPEEQFCAEEEHSNTERGFFSADSMMLRTDTSSGVLLRAKPPLAPLKDFRISSLAKACKIFAKKEREIPNRFDSVSTSTGSPALAIRTVESNAYSLAFVNNMFYTNFSRLNLSYYILILLNQKKFPILFKNKV